MTTVRSAPLGELVEFVGGGTPPRGRAEYFGGPVPWITPKDMKAWNLTSSEVQITEDAVANSAAKPIPPNAVLVVVRSGVLKRTLPVALNRVPATVNQDMKALICGEDLAPDYLARFLKWSEPRILGWARATTADNIPVDRLRALEVPLPPLAEQRRIAAMLDKADGVRRKRREAIGLLDDLLRSAYVAMVGPGSDDYKKWPECHVADLAESGPQSMRTGPFGSTLRHSEFLDKGIAVLGIDNAVQNRFAWGERRFVTQQKYEQLRRYTVKPGDVIITIMGTTGRSAVVPDDIPLAISTKHLAVITVDRKRVHPEFLSHAIHSDPTVLSQITAANRGAIMAGLNLGLIKRLRLRLPPLSVQCRFAALRLGVSRARQRFDCALHRADRLYGSLTQRAFARGNDNT